MPRTDRALVDDPNLALEPRAARPLPRRELQRQETREKVFQAALAVFRRDGVASARIEDIVRAAGVSRGTFYFHFPTKEQVLADLLHASELRIVEKLATLPESTPIRTVLETVCAALAVEWQTDPKIFPEVGVVGVRIAAAGLATAQTSPVRAALAERFRLAYARQELSPLFDPALQSDIFLVNMFAASLAWCATASLPLATVLQSAVRLFFDGVGHSV